MAGQEELNEFLNDPEKYVPPMAPNKLPPPELRPIRRTGAYMKEHFPLQIELQGYCPVSFKDGKQRLENYEVFRRSSCLCVCVGGGLLWYLKKITIRCLKHLKIKKIYLYLHEI